MKRRGAEPRCSIENLITNAPEAPHGLRHQTSRTDASVATCALRPFYLMHAAEEMRRAGIDVQMVPSAGAKIVGSSAKAGRTDALDLISKSPTAPGPKTKKNRGGVGVAGLRLKEFSSFGAEPAKQKRSHEMGSVRWLVFFVACVLMLCCSCSCLRPALCWSYPLYCLSVENESSLLQNHSNGLRRATCSLLQGGTSGPENLFTNRTALCCPYQSHSFISRDASHLRCHSNWLRRATCSLHCS